ncbi:MAG: glycoside hydrolase family 2, partial [Planctomycetaceae bacterium]|nr:glycoside hydrolase family 2 [Planctomycetaceae bacterium]
MKRLLVAVILTVLAGATEWSAAMAQSAPDGPWRFTTERPGDQWMKPEFNDANWKTGSGGFGEESTPGSRVNTEWTTSDIWLRRTVTLAEIPAAPALYIYHDEDAEVFINGRKVASFRGFVPNYFVSRLNDEALETLKTGDNTLAVHCHQTTGGQFIDVHLINADRVPQLPLPLAQQTPFQSELITPWGAEVTAENAWREYPRPHLRRDQWTNLNGTWQYAITDGDVTERPAKWDGDVLVPFCIESRLSGVQRLLQPNQALWYTRTFEIAETAEKRTLLNFEAVDYQCSVHVNGKHVGGHQGGNLPFTIDATDAVRTGTNELTVRVTDSTGGAQLRGKQTLQPRGIWYTRVSGIWQTVWLEQAAARHITNVAVTTRLKDSTINVKVDTAGAALPGEQLRLTVTDGDRRIAAVTGTPTLSIPQPHLWSPADPHLYDLRVEILDAAGSVVDAADSYFGMREVGTFRDSNGHMRFTLNGAEIFHWGPLDQGWWPDGLLTPPSDEAMVSDIQFLQDAGFNMIRKHIKV